METKIIVKEIKTVAYGQNQEKELWKITSETGEIYTTFSSTVLDEAKCANIDGVERTIDYITKPSTNPAYPDSMIVNRMSNDKGVMPEVVKKTGGGGGFGKADPAKQESIERQNAMNNAVHLAVAWNKTDMKEVIKLAEEVLVWTRGGKTNA